MFPTSSFIYGRQGNDYGKQIKLFKNIWTFTLVTDQVVSPLLTVRKIEKGISLYGVAFSMSRRYRIWHDNTEPRVEITKAFGSFWD